MGAWDDIKGALDTTTDAVGDVPVIGSFSRAIGLSGSKSGNLSEDAQEAVAQSNANAQQAFATALAQAQAAGLIQAPVPVSAPGVSAPTVTAGLVDRSEITSDPLQLAQSFNYAAQGYNAKTANAVGAGSAMTGYDAALADAARVAAVDPAEVADVRTDVLAPTIGDAALANRVQVGNAYIDPLSTDGREETLAAARAIAAGPSSATSQFKSSMDKATADALAVAAQARGSERAGARREAIIQMALKGGASAEAAAATAAQEEQAKRVASAAALQNVRGADISVSQTQAQLDAQRAQTQAQLDAAIEQGNTAAINELKKQKATLDLQAQTVATQARLQQQATQAGLQKANLDSSTTRALADAANATNVSLANTAARTKAAADLAAAKNLAEREYAQTASGVNVSNAAAQTKAAADTAAAINAASAQGSTQMSATSLSNAQLAAQRAEGNAQRALTAGTTDAGNRTTASQTTGQLGVEAGKANATSALTAGQINTNAALDAERIKQGATTSAVSGMNQAASIQGGNVAPVVGAQAAEAGAQTKGDTAVIAGAADLAEMIAKGQTSDRRVKRDISKVSDNELLDLADKLNSYTWRYKPGVEDSGENVHGGWMAQELERSALGKKFVQEDETGTKHVDTLSLAGLLAAAAARSMRKERRT